MNDIIKLLDLKDDSIVYENIELADNVYYITISKAFVPHYCPECSFKMRSKGFYNRIINYPVLQNGFRVKLIFRQRKWHCENPECNAYYNDTFSFVRKYSHNANVVPYMILNELKDISVTAVQAARKFNVSDTYVHNIVLNYLHPERLPLPEILSVDEVYLNFNSYNRYALVLMDFMTGEIIDILPNRLEDTTSDYFYHIDIKERNKVRYIVCDMYNPYVNFTSKYFRKARTIIDSFHVIQWINNKLNLYILSVKKKYQKRDQELLSKENYENNHNFKKRKVSKEVYILNNYKWVLLSNNEELDYHTERHYNRTLQMYLDTYEIEKQFMNLDSNFSELRDLKELYIQFNSSFPKDYETASSELEFLIKLYGESKFQMFREFSELLSRYKNEIINSFSELPESSLDGAALRRISNGPMEGFNRKPKDLKRNSRGVSDFEYTRNRILWSNRKNEPVVLDPKIYKK